MKKEIKFLPAFDKRHVNPNKNYGIHGVDLLAILKGELGAVTFRVFTGWHLPHVQKELDEKVLSGNIKPENVPTFYHPMPADISYHSPIQKYQNQSKMKDCPYLDGKTCYCDGSGLNAMPIFDALVSGGSDALWKELEEYYLLVFGELK